MRVAQEERILEVVAVVVVVVCVDDLDWCVEGRIGGGECGLAAAQVDRLVVGDVLLLLLLIVVLRVVCV